MTREEAIKMLKSKMDGNTDTSYEWVETVRMAIKALEQEPSSLGKPNEWIPVSERLPKEEGDYLLWGKVCEDEEEYQFIGSYDSGCEQFGIWQEQFDRTTLGCLGSEFFEYASVTAWMPLPEPYKGENESEECRGCHYNDGEPHAECVLCTKGRAYY